MGINSSVLHKKTIKSPEIKHEKPIKSPEIKHEKVKSPKIKHEKPIKSPEIKHEKPIKLPEIKHEKSIKTPKRKHEKPIKTPKTNPHRPPQLSYYVGMSNTDYSLDFANACLVEFDTTSLKIHDYVSYNFLLSFRDTCRNYSVVTCFHPNPKTHERTVLRGEVVPEDMDANNHATAAINQYNNLTQNGKLLKLERLIDSARYSLKGDNFFYILFYAMDMESSTSSMYQVGMTELGGQPLLGLLRDYSNDKILAVISLKGSAAVKKRNLVSSQATD